MRAQVKKLTDCGFRALYVTTEAECKEALSDGTITHVFLSPDTLVSSFSDQLAEVIGLQPWSSIFQFRRTKSRIQFDNLFWFISLLSTTKKKFP